jgi:hypothetical protein
VPVEEEGAVSAVEAEVATREWKAKQDWRQIQQHLSAEMGVVMGVEVGVLMALV